MFDGAINGAITGAIIGAVAGLVIWVVRKLNPPAGAPKDNSDT